MEKIKELKQILKEWETRAKILRRNGRIRETIEADGIIYGLRLALNIFKENIK